MFFVRTASVRDADKIQSLLIDTWHDTYDAIYSVEMVNDICADWHNLEAIGKNIDARNAEYVVADSGEEIGGMAFVKAPNEEGIAYLSQLYVLPKLQGQGIGKDLLGEIELNFPEAKKMRLGVDSNNLKAIGFYEHMGYENTGFSFEDTVSGRTIQALILEKAIG